MPQAIQTARALNSRVTPRTVERADAPSIRRDQDPRITTLQKARVAVLGSGSVGGHVAGLPRAGRESRGQFLLIDPEVLTWANTGRHILVRNLLGRGRPRLWLSESESELPHLKSVAVEPTSWQQVMRTSGHLLSDCELIISTIGDWSSECQLNAWHMEKELQSQFYMAGRKLMAVEATQSWFHHVRLALNVGSQIDGIPLASGWPLAKQMYDSQEPACSTTFRPYGPVELMHVCAMIAELAIESLLETQTRSVHRIWAGSRNSWDRLAGDRTQAWRDLAQNDDPERRQLKRDSPDLRHASHVGKDRMPVIR